MHFQLLPVNIPKKDTFSNINKNIMGSHAGHILPIAFANLPVRAFSFAANAGRRGGRQRLRGCELVWQRVLRLLALCGLPSPKRRRTTLHRC
jgi:hypothetical protein